MSPKTKRPRVPTAAGMVAAGGWVNFTRAVRHVARYSLVESDAKRWVEWSEYVELSPLSTAQVYRDRQAFRACVGDDVSERDVMREFAGWLYQKTEAEREATFAQELLRRGGA